MKLKTIFRESVLFISFPTLFLFSCSSSGFPGDELSELTYPIEIVESGLAVLESGYYSEPAAPGSVSEVLVKLTEHRAFGYLDVDRSMDAVVVLDASGGGSGRFSYLAVILNRGNELYVLPSVFIGDRIIVESLSLHDRSISLEYLDRGGSQAMSSKPSLLNQKVYYVDGVNLIVVPK